MVTVLSIQNYVVMPLFSNWSENLQGQIQGQPIIWKNKYGASAPGLEWRPDLLDDLGCLFLILKVDFNSIPVCKWINWFNIK